jgi:hypothetical protein
MAIREKEDLNASSKEREGFFKLAVHALSRTSGKSKNVVLLCTMFLALSLCFGTTLVLYDDTRKYGVCCLIAACIVVIGSFVAVVKLEKELSAPPATPAESPLEPPIQMIWNRAVLSLPLSDDTATRLRDGLENVHQQAFVRVTKLDNRFKLEDIRANIFLADYTGASDGFACRLSIPPRLQFNMDADDDREISFRPGQGCTGKVFVREVALIGVPTEIDPHTDEFDDLYSLSADQKKLLHPELRWVVSMPLNFNDPETKRAKTVAVLNIDGLRYSLDNDKLATLSLAVAALVARKIQPMLAELAKVRLIVGVRQKL